MQSIFMDIKGDTITSKRVVEGNGFITIKDCALSRTGVFKYRAKELGDVAKDFEPYDTIGVYRSEEEVFDSVSMESFKSCIVTDDHPPVMVDSKNSREYTRGFTIGEVRRDGNKLVGDLKITDDETIRKVNSGKQEISNGYYSSLIRQDGVSPDGEPYQFIQTKIKGNHVAIVNRGRAGSECRLSDAAIELFDEAMKEVDGKEYPASAFAYTPDKEKPSTWKLPIPNLEKAKLAAQALTSGIWGNKVEIPEEDLPAVKSKVRSALKEFGGDEEDISKLKDNYMETTVSYVKDSQDITVDFKDSPQDIIDYVCYLNEQIDALTAAKEEALSKATQDAECYSRSVKEVEDAMKRATEAEASLADSSEKIVKMEGEVASLKDTVSSLESQIIDGDTLDAMLNERIELSDCIHSYYPTMDLKGLNNEQMKRKFVKERSTTVKSDEAPLELVDMLFAEFTSQPAESTLRDSLSQQFAKSASAVATACVDNDPTDIVNRYKK